MNPYITSGELRYLLDLAAKAPATVADGYRAFELISRAVSLAELPADTRLVAEASGEAAVQPASNDESVEAAVA